MKDKIQKTVYFFCSSSNFSNPIIALVLITFFGGCTATRYLGEGEKFYKGGDVTISSQDQITQQSRLNYSLSNELRPTPNVSILGTRPLVWWYYVMGDTKGKKGVRNWIKTKIGRPPVLWQDVFPERTKNLLENKLYNQGYLHARVDYEVQDKANSASIQYKANIHSRLRINKYGFADSARAKSLINIPDILNNSIIEEGDAFNLELLEQERNRIEKYLKNQGYYFFESDFLHFQADTTNNSVNLFLQIDPNIPQNALKVYELDSINVFFRQNFQSLSNLSNIEPLFIDSMYYFNTFDQLTFKPSVLTRTITLKHGKKYSQETYNNTLNRLVGLENFKFVNIRFEATTDDKLNANIYLTPMQPKSLRAELRAVSKSNNFVGPSLNFTWRNKNLTGSSDLLSLALNGGFETQINTKGNPLNTWEAGITANYSIPRLLIPFSQWGNQLPYIPHTQLSFSTRLLNRLTFFKQRAFNTKYSYQWNKTRHRQHVLDLLDISFVKFFDRSPSFEELLNEQNLLSQSYTEQFLIGSGYTFNYNTKLKEGSQSKRNNYYFNGNIDLSGNLLNFLQKIGSKQNFPSSEKIFGENYAQFTKISGEAGFIHQIDRKNTLASRLFLGAGIPYGNSTSLPYTKQFASGGSSSIRAFPARSLGPGSFRNDTLRENGRNTFFDQTGDIKIEANLEYRFNILGAFKGAMFADAGNIWLTSEDEDRPGAKFAFNSFINDLALGTGVGVRYDADFFVLRFDLAFPLRKPYLPENNRWVIDEIAFGNPAWRKQNLILNIAIGYPF